MICAQRNDAGFGSRAFFIALLVIIVLPVSASYAGSSDSPLEVVLAGTSDGFFARQKAASKLGASLDAESVERLYAFMDSKSDPGLSGSELLALKDVICTKLDRQAEYPNDLPEKLMAMFGDKEHDEGWRDYCIQHLNVGFKKASAEQRVAIVKTLWAAAEEKGSSIAGTALIALKDNMSDENIERDAIAAKALDIVLSKKSGDAAKTTALQICAQLGERKCLPVARELTATTKARTLKLSSIAAIGALGSKADKVILEKHASSKDRFTQLAAKAALDRVNARIAEHAEGQNSLKIGYGDNNGLRDQRDPIRGEL